MLSQVKGLLKSMANGKKLLQAAQRADMCKNTARKFVELNLPRSNVGDQ